MVIVYCICHEGTQRAVILALGFRNLCAEMGFHGGLDGKEFSCNAGNLDLIPGLRRFLGEGNSNPLQYSCLGNPVDRGAWQAYSPCGHRVGHDWVTNTFSFMC